MRRFLFLLCLLLLLGPVCTHARGAPQLVEEASGITRLSDHLLIVGDDDPGAYYRFSLLGVQGPLIRIDPSRLTRVVLPQGNLAIDLESIDVLADGRVVVLSERLRALVGEDGVIAEYDNQLSEFGNRGLEGLAVKPLDQGTSRVAVLWEGGYPEHTAVPGQRHRHIGRLAMQPVIWIHDIEAGEAGIAIKSKTALRVVVLDVPKPVGQEPQAQRFRAPDLVWNQMDNDGDGKKDWGFIILLSSQNSPDQGRPEYRHQWLQRFTTQGKPAGMPLDLNTIVPTALKGANWEGLSWFEEGKRLVLIHDKPPKGPPTAFIVDLPNDWK